MKVSTNGVRSAPLLAALSLPSGHRNIFHSSQYLRLCIHSRSDRASI